MNRACIAAMTDEELVNIISMIEAEQLLRKRGEELQQEREQKRRILDMDARCVHSTDGEMV